MSSNKSIPQTGANNKGSRQGQGQQGGQGSMGLPGPGSRGRGSRIERAKDIKGTTRRLLEYLKNKDITRYRQLTENLGLRR